MEEYRLTFSRNLQCYMDLFGFNQKDIAEKIKTNKSVVSSWINCTRYPRMNTIERLASLFGIEKSDLTDDKDTSAPPRTKGIRIPILGKVVAGIPLEAIEDIEGYEEITPAMARKGEYFALRVRGKSMEPFMLDGDIVIVRKQEAADSGDIVIVLVNGDEATVKEIKIHEDGLMLIGKNVAVYSPHFYNQKQIEELPVQIIGKVVEVRRSL